MGDNIFATYITAATADITIQPQYNGSKICQNFTKLNISQGDHSPSVHIKDYIRIIFHLQNQIIFTVETSIYLPVRVIRDRVYDHLKSVVANLNDFQFGCDSVREFKDGKTLFGEGIKQDSLFEIKLNNLKQYFHITVLLPEDQQKVILVRDTMKICELYPLLKLPGNFDQKSIGKILINDEKERINMNDTLHTAGLKANSKIEVIDIVFVKLGNELKAKIIRSQKVRDAIHKIKNVLNLKYKEIDLVINGFKLNMHKSFEAQNIQPFSIIDIIYTEEQQEYRIKIKSSSQQQRNLSINVMSHWRFRNILQIVAKYYGIDVTQVSLRNQNSNNRFTWASQFQELNLSNNDTLVLEDTVQLRYNNTTLITKRPILLTDTPRTARAILKDNFSLRSTDEINFFFDTWLSLDKPFIQNKGLDRNSQIELSTDSEIAVVIRFNEQYEKTLICNALDEVQTVLGLFYTKYKVKINPLTQIAIEGYYSISGDNRMGKFSDKKKIQIYAMIQKNDLTIIQERDKLEEQQQQQAYQSIIYSTILAYRSTIYGSQKQDNDSLMEPIQLIQEKQDIQNSVYFQYFFSTEKIVTFQEILDDLKSFEEGQQYQDKLREYYDTFKDDEEPLRTQKACIKLYTSDFHKNLNKALRFDKAQFCKDEFTENTQNTTAQQMQNWIKFTMKIQRSMNTYIVREGQKNDHEQIVYRGVAQASLLSCEVDQQYRIAQWLSCSTDSRIGLEFCGRGPNQTLLRIKIPPRCCNACYIGNDELTVHPREKEVLIPPYSVLTITNKFSGLNKDPNYIQELRPIKEYQDFIVNQNSTIIEAELVQDNRNYPLLWKKDNLAQ